MAIAPGDERHSSAHELEIETRQFLERHVGRPRKAAVYSPLDDRGTSRLRAGEGAGVGDELFSHSQPLSSP